ncbi:MAG: 4Fe-4S binding protein [Methanosphaera sp.]|nr:4Fe-4S binding protein [Methanosphaera sp.]
MVVTLYKDRCKGINECPLNGHCIDICALDAIENIDNQPVISENICIGCGLCVMNCPNEALSK